MVTLRADPWSPDYGGDVEATLAAREGTEIQVDPTIETADWSRRDRAGRRDPGGPLLFVDGVRRVELRVLAEDGGRRAWGLAGSYAVGAVRSDGRATFEQAIVGRILALGAAIAAPGPGRPRRCRPSRSSTGPSRSRATIPRRRSRSSRTRCARPRAGWRPSSPRPGSSWPMARSTTRTDRMRRSSGSPSGWSRRTSRTSRRRSCHGSSPASGRRCSRSAARSSTGSPGTSG